jgi:hypothetical protein
MAWGTSIKNDIVYHDFALKTPRQYSEKNSRIEYGRAYHATSMTQGVSYATCSHYNCRTMFTGNGRLDGSQDKTFRAVAKDWPVMALSYSLGAITKTQEPLVFAIGHARDPVVEYRGPKNVVEERSLFFHTFFVSIDDAVSALSPPSPLFLIDQFSPSSSLSSSRIIRALSKQPMHSIAN